jgi:pyridoxamine 5'-phosphate oxidase
MLLRGVDDSGFVFYTDLRSRKGREIAANAKAALAWYGAQVGRQFRVEGAVERVDADTVEAYWTARERGKRLAAATSIQSRPLASRRVLLDRLRRVRARFRFQRVRRPYAWTGLRLVPTTVELWIRRSHRLHHRELFVRSRDGWRRTLLEP